MTDDQKSALEELAERVLTAEEITILGPLLDIRNDVEIARIISAGRVKYPPTQIGAGTIVAVMGEQGGPFLDAVLSLGEADRNVYWGMDPVRRGAFDLGVPAAREWLATLKIKLPAFADSIDNLLVVFQRPDIVDFNKVSDALNVAEGRMTL